MDEKAVQSILEQAGKLMRSSEESEKSSGGYFNLLKIARIGTDEVKMCRIIADIINPNGTHCQGSVFLDKFSKTVLGIDMDEVELAKARVYTEYPTDENRKIDIVISTPHRFIPVEVKVYAHDQKKQCGHYYEFAKGLNKQIPSSIYYLTIDGHLPESDDGLTGIIENNDVVGYEELVPISFKRDISVWLEECIAEVEDMPLILGGFLQFKNTIDSWSTNMNTELNHKITNLISSDSESIKTAFAVAEGVNTAKKNILIKVLEAIEKRMCTVAERFGLEHAEYEWDYRYNNYYQIKNYGGRRRMYPSIPYRYRKIDENREIWFLIEIGYWMYCGFVAAQKGRNHGQVLNKEEIEQHLDMKMGYRESEWWFYWEYLPMDDEEGTYTPDFNVGNEEFFRLFDEEYFDDFIDRCMERIEYVLEEMTK